MDRLIANMIVNDSDRLLKLSSTIINYRDRLNGPLHLYSRLDHSIGDFYSAKIAEKALELRNVLVKDIRK